MRKFFSKIKALFTKSDVEKTSLQKTARISIIFAVVALVGLIVYFAIVAPILNRREKTEGRGKVLSFSVSSLRQIVIRLQLKTR